MGQLGLFSFADNKVLTAIGTNRFEAPKTVKPGVSAATVEQGAVEGSNEDAVEGTMQLVMVQRQAQMMQKALGVFDMQFDKVAAEDLPKV